VIDYYDILGITPDATEKEIRWAYRRMVFESHPDRNGSSPNADVLLQQINEAYHVLSTPDLRADYDRALFGSSLNSSTSNARTHSQINFSTQPTLLSTAVIRTFSLGWTLSGCIFALALEDSFFPMFPFTGELIGVLLLALLGGGFANALAERFGLPKIDGSFLGVFLGAFIGATWLSPEADSYSFFMIVKLSLGSGVAGFLGGALSGWAFTLPPLGLGTRTRLGGGLIFGTVLGACLGGLVGLSLSYQLSDEIFLALLALEPSENLELHLILLGSIAAGAGGFLVGLKRVSEKPSGQK
jgi:hypothetical protein